MSRSRITPKKQYCVATTRGRKTKFWWGETLNGAMALAGLKRGDTFTYTRYDGSRETFAEFNGDTISIYPVNRVD